MLYLYPKGYNHIKVARKVNPEIKIYAIEIDQKAFKLNAELI